MSDPDSCPICGIFWKYHDPERCLESQYQENVERDIKIYELEAQIDALKEKLEQVITEKEDSKNITDYDMEVDYYDGDYEEDDYYDPYDDELVEG